MHLTRPHYLLPLQFCSTESRVNKTHAALVAASRFRRSLSLAFESFFVTCHEISRYSRAVN